jgi:hypothetical protein
MYLRFCYCKNVVSTRRTSIIRKYFSATIRFHNGLKKGYSSELFCMFPVPYDIKIKENQGGLKFIDPCQFLRFYCWCDLEIVVP